MQNDFDSRYEHERICLLHDTRKDSNDRDDCEQRNKQQNYENPFILLLILPMQQTGAYSTFYARNLEFCNLETK